MMLRISSSKESPMQASKWLSLPLLIDYLEMLQLFEALEPFLLYRVGQVLLEGKGQISPEDFLSTYKYYIDSLKQGMIPEESIYNSHFNSVFTRTSDSLFAIEIPNNRHLIRICQPVIQVQPHWMDYSPYDDKFRSNMHGPESISWGIMFTYPQLYLDPQTKEPVKVVDREAFPNTYLYRLLQKWCRANTTPTPFRIGDKTVKVPVRIGKGCLDWIHHHPQLKFKNLNIIRG
jgi:hypothetical protein